VVGAQLKTWEDEGRGCDKSPEEYSLRVTLTANW